MQYGHFDNKNLEYVIDRVDLPVSWTNYLGVQDSCCVINHTGGGYLFYKSPEYHRITRFRGNAVPMDRPGYDVYIRDNETKDYFSVTWQPVGKALNKAKYSCRHGLSYTVYSCEYEGIKASQRMSIPLDENVLLWDVVIENASDRIRSLSAFTFAEFSYHHVMIDNQNFQMSLYCAGSSYADGIIEHDLFYEEHGYQYFTMSTIPDGYDGLRDAFLGIYHTEKDPVAVIRGKCSGSSEKGGNHCASLQKNLLLKPGEKIRLIYMLGEGDRNEGRRIRAKYRDPQVVDDSYERMRRFWENKMKHLQIQTPSVAMNTMLNIWTLYQSEINVMFSRFASFIEVGGRTGLGYRDTAQDAMTVIHSNPEKCRERIIQLMQGLTSAGYGIHLFEPEWFAPKDPEAKEKKPFKSPTVIPEVHGKDRVHGLEDACADDALWLIPSVVEYIKETGDFAFISLEVGYADGGSGSIYEHMKRILDFSAQQIGSHGICKGLRADWNDCLNLGGGESAMVSYLHVNALEKFLELARELNRPDDISWYTYIQQKIKKVCEEQLWDGQWYLRGFTAGGRKIGTQEAAEGRIHLESNAWAVLSGAADREHARIALDSVHRHLATPYGIRLNAPSYTKPDDEIGFITRVYPGVKENGSIFSHPNPWVWAAECRIGNGDRAFEYYNSLCPYNQNDKIEIRQSEPYSYCQFIMGPDHSAYGRARHPFMTGSGGWAYYSATHYMLGIRPDFHSLIVDPCIPREWDGFTALRIWKGAGYQITVKNPKHVCKGVKEILVNDRRVLSIPEMPRGTATRVEVILG